MSVRAEHVYAAHKPTHTHTHSIHNAQQAENHVKNSHFFRCCRYRRKKGEEVVLFFVCMNTQNLRHIIYTNAYLRLYIYILYLLHDIKDVQYNALLVLCYGNGRDTDILDAHTPIIMP